MPVFSDSWKCGIIILSGDAEFSDIKPSIVVDQ